MSNYYSEDDYESDKEENLDLEFNNYYKQFEESYQKINEYVKELGDDSFLFSYTINDLIKLSEKGEFNKKIIKKTEQLPEIVVDPEIIYAIQPEITDGWVSMRDFIKEDIVVEENEKEEEKVEEEKKIDIYNWTIPEDIRGIKKKNLRKESGKDICFQ